MIKLGQVKLMITDMIEEIKNVYAINHKHKNANNNNTSNQLTNKLIRSLLKIRPLTKKLQFHYTQTIITITHMNISFVAPQFFAFMIVSAPLNCILVYALLFNNVPLISVVLILAAVIQEITCHFIIHLFFAKLNQRIMSPLKCFRSLTTMVDFILQRRLQSDQYSEQQQKLVKFLIGDSNKYAGYLNIHDHIRWHCFVCDYINKRSYGFTYNKFGKISMSSFVKVIE